MNQIVASARQKGNPILSHVNNLSIDFRNDVLADFVIGSTTCVVFISFRFHVLNKLYLASRLKDIGSKFRLRVILCQADQADDSITMTEINLLGIKFSAVVLIAFSAEGAAKYLESLVLYQSSSVTSIQQRLDDEPLPRAQEIICSYSRKSSNFKSAPVPNKTDAITILRTYTNLRRVFKAKASSIVMCPGIGVKKAQRLHDIFRANFRVSKRKRDEDIAEEIVNEADILDDDNDDDEEVKIADTVVVI